VSNSGYFKLIVMQGAASSREFELFKADSIIGRDPSVDVVIDAPGVSRRHARITRQADRYLLEDLGSSNGTFLNGQRLVEVAPLNPGDEIRLGNSVVLAFEAPVVEDVPMKQPPDQAEPELMQTFLAAEEEIALPDIPQAAPQMVVTVAGDEPDIITLTRDIYTIGRAEDNDIIIHSPIVSRHHAQLERTNGGYRFTTLPDAGNPVLFEGRPLTGSQTLRHEDKLRIGGRDPGVMVTMTYNSPTEAAAAADVLTVGFEHKTTLTIGRATDNDVVLDSPQVSRYHAQIERIGQRYRVRDLRSSNGTFVNDQRIEGDTWLKANDVIRIGANSFVMGENQLAQFSEASGRRVDVYGLSKWVRKDLNILQDISLSFQPREFIVVVGQSGGGKSTLVDAIAGYRPATHGRVFVNDIDVYNNFDAIRNDIGFVPQKDIIHMELTVFQALDFAAQLRLPADTTQAERHQRVMSVLDDLDLAHRKDVQISGLSGGQQKRVSIGVELLTKPGLFFLDEPTSGLDPGTETALMQLMRRLADQGRTIVLITHATKNVMLADKVIFLARGGYLAWFGPPDEALKYFDQYRSARSQRTSEMAFDDIYAILESSENGTPQEWAGRYKQHPAYWEYIVKPLQEKGQAAEAASATVHPKADSQSTRGRQVSSLRQFMILSARNLKILTRDRFSLALMLASAPLVGLLDFVLASLLGRNPFDFLRGNVFNSLIILFMLCLYGVMVGAIGMMREIVKEQDIYKRERLVNLKILPYVLSKVWIAALLALYQAACYVIIRNLAFNMPGGLLEFALMYVIMALATMAGMMWGLFGSALAPNANSAPLLVILFILPQIVLGGALIPLPTYVSAPTSTRWAFEGLMAVSGIGSDVAKDVCWSLPDPARNALTLEEKADLGCNCMGLNMLYEDSCNFPSLGRFYDPLIDEPLPVEPAPLRPEPAEPVLPERPVEPTDQSDSVAMAEFFEALQDWEAEANAIEAEYRAELDLYRADAAVFQAEQVAYQTSLAERQIAQESAVVPAETLVNQLNRDMGWTFVDKENTPAFFAKVISTWLAQLAIILILFVGILILQKRKDVV